jgi:hypothetical protein
VYDKDELSSRFSSISACVEVLPPNRKKHEEIQKAFEDFAELLNGLIPQGIFAMEAYVSLSAVSQKAHQAVRNYAKNVGIDLSKLSKKQFTAEEIDSYIPSVEAERSNFLRNLSMIDKQEGFGRDEAPLSTPEADIPPPPIPSNDPEERI